MGARLKSLGYDVEGVTPDIHQKKLIIGADFVDSGCQHP
jgi:hypothetical protein